MPLRSAIGRQRRGSPYSRAAIARQRLALADDVALGVVGGLALDLLRLELDVAELVEA